MNVVELRGLDIFWSRCQTRNTMHHAVHYTGVPRHFHTSRFFSAKSWCSEDLDKGLNPTIISCRGVWGSITRVEYRVVTSAG